MLDLFKLTRLISEFSHPRSADVVVAHYIEIRYPREEFFSFSDPPNSVADLSDFEIMAARTQVEQGTLEGVKEGDVFKFLGVPYAGPPVGDLRWRAPQPPDAWTGVRHAQKFGPISPQTVGASFDVRQPEESEDCLYLNVWTTTCEASDKQPVMVWIHGGGNLGGAGSEDAFDGTRLAGKGVTLVTINYRLGAFGFLAHPKIGSNFGVLDQIAALVWVRANVAGFGGDPTNVTIFGQSAGAVAVRTLLSCPQAKGLFHRAILQSPGFGPAFTQSWSSTRIYKAAEALFTKLGSEDPEELRRVPTAAVKKVSFELSGLPPPPGQVHTPANLVWMPIVDGKIVEHDLAGWPDTVPIMIGCVENEARYFTRPGGNYTKQGLSAMIQVLCGSQAEAVDSIFEKSDVPLYDRLDKIFTTAIFTEPAMVGVRKFAALGRRCYCYHFNRRSPGSVTRNELAKHTAEIRYVFGNLTEDGYYDDSDHALSELLQSAWVSFARSGIPTSPDGHAWPAYDASNPEVAWIEDGVDIREFPATDLMLAVNKLR